MYATACATLASIAPAAPPFLPAVSAVAFWVALAAWCVTAVGMVADAVSRSGRVANG